MLEAEGVRRDECLRILRHETGHAVDEAFQLFRTAEYKRVFGAADRRYPRAYSVDLRSNAYVTNLNAWYAQSHPVEDFAETFAVWLTSPRHWRRRYAGTDALAKLETVSRWMRDRAGRLPVISPEPHASELATNPRTLAEHYEEKRRFYRIGVADEYDALLTSLFPPIHRRADASISAASFLRARRRSLRSKVGGSLGVPAYAVDQVVRQLALRAAALGLRVDVASRSVDRQVASMVETVVRKFVQATPRLPL
jgi:hypothetical protein